MAEIIMMAAVMSTIFGLIVYSVDMVLRIFSDIKENNSLEDSDL